MLEIEKRAYIQQLYEKYSQSLWGYAYYLSKDKELSNDIVQTVFLNMTKHVSTLQNISEESRKKAYLNTAIRNTFYNAVKKEEKYATGIPYDELYEEPVQNTLYEDVENKELIQAMICTLTEKEKDLLNLYYFVGLSMKEISEVMNISQTNCKVSLYYVRQKLKRKFKL